MQMDLVTGRDLQDRRLDLGKTLLVEPGPDRSGDCIASRRERPDVGMAADGPPWRGLGAGPLIGFLSQIDHAGALARIIGPLWMTKPAIGIKWPSFAHLQVIARSVQSSRV